MGQGADYLTYKYINTLKKLVISREEKTLKEKNQALISSILKKQNFNKSFKSANVISREKMQRRITRYLPERK